MWFNFGDNTVDIYDTTDPTAPGHVGEFGIGDLLLPTGIAIQGPTLYVANQGDASVYVGKISNPFSPLFIDSI